MFAARTAGRHRTFVWPIDTAAVTAPKKRTVRRTVRRLIGRIVRRIRRGADVVERRLLWDDPERARERRTYLRHQALYDLADRVRRIDDTVPRSADADGRPALPSVARTQQIRREAMLHGAEHRFFDELTAGRPVDEAMLRAIRSLLRQRHVRRARAAAASMQAQPALAVAGDVAMALVALEDRVPDTAWQLMERHDLETVRRLATPELVSLAFRRDPMRAASLLQETLAAEAVLTAAQWFDLAAAAFLADESDLSAAALQRSRSLCGPELSPDLWARIEWLQPWYARAAERHRVPTTTPGTIPFAVLDYRQPDRTRASSNLGDHVQTIASLGHVVRHRGFRFTGDPELTAVATTLQQRVARRRRIDGDDAVLELHRVDRDASSYAAVPDGTWALTFGWLMHPMFQTTYDAPMNPRLRPIFISVHINDLELLTPEAVAWFRRYAPVGCRDWNTVHLLQAAGVPAFFSGCLTTTIDAVFPDSPPTERHGTLFVDTPATGPGESWTQVFDEVRQRPFAENIAHALRQLERYRGELRSVVTSRLHTYLPARALGADVTFRPKNPADVRFDGLAGIDDAEFAAIQQGISDKLARVITAIGAGRSEDEVYALWREICRPDVERATALRTSIARIAAPTVDLDTAIREVRARSVVTERILPGPAGPEVHVEVSLDGNLKHQLDVVLESIVTNASRPLRVYVLCRDHGAGDFARVADAFPTVSFVWLPTDTVDYGEVLGMIEHITVATMDRLLLPLLLPEVPKIVHHDLDAVCLADIAELFDTPLGDAPLAARTSPQPSARSGFLGFARASTRLAHDRDLARELILRTHTRHAFDFDGFNAGIMVLNLDRMRRDDFCREFLPYAERFGLNDQEVLNAYAGADRVPLDEDWNRLPRLEVITTPKIVHWAGFQKPWNVEPVAAQEYWREYEQRFALRTDRTRARATVRA